MRRVRKPELMDDPSLEPSRHRHALQGLERINRFTGSADIIWRPLSRLALQFGNLKVLDIATGGGDLPLMLWQKSRQAGLNLEIHGCDASSTAVEHACLKAERTRSKVHFFRLDILQEGIKEKYDLIFNSLFMHHLDPDDVVSVLKKMSIASTRKLLVSDLSRSWWSLTLVSLGTRLLSSSDVVHYDGPVSVKAAYTPAEMTELSLRAGLEQVSIKSVFPCRYLLEASR